MTDQTWRTQARCSTEHADPNLFVDTIHDEDPGDRMKRHEQAAEFCVRCPVKDQCLAAGLADGEEGVWGQRLMLTGRSRRALPKLILTVGQRRAARIVRERAQRGEVA